ncbi:hypothetical protein DSO57_1039363 [Entomophthora muscae]|uniref:Uncharacterized protein n=1 Tax=Entomophthora muscae TaxID=34485 RepID=A0ACC2TXX6_9FUNG|nr:hypothetical protein DSO57_1039363 [Entomophthora muscae]
MKKLKLAPDFNYTQPYGTSGMAQTQAIGAYSALLMRFGKLLIASHVVVLENKSYNLLVVSNQQAQSANKVLSKRVCDPQPNYPVTQSQTRKLTQISKSNNMNR